MSLTEHTKNYVFDQYHRDQPDPLICILACTPYASEYKSLDSDWRRSGYLSAQHVNLLTFLHKLGLRGVPKYRP